MACALRRLAARPSRIAVCACAINCSTVDAAWAPVSVPLSFIAASTWSQAGCKAPVACCAALPTDAKRTSSIFSIFAIASFMCFSCSARPWSTNCCRALRCACTACSRAASRPEKALPSSSPISTAGNVFRPNPVDAAWLTVSSTLRMFVRVNSRPCSAFSVASATALRSTSPCRAVACENIWTMASWSIPALNIVVSRWVSDKSAVHRHCMCWPPLIAMLAPVTNAASSEAR